jgi:[histone H3]-lysine4 N-trimethyltransferase ASH1L
MPLRQSLLSFGSTPSASSLTALPAMPGTRPKTVRMATTSTDSEGDTIIVDTAAPKAPLPTPSETDNSSESSQVIEIKRIPQRKPKRVNRQPTRSRKSIDGVLAGAESAEKPESRSVSGETLVTNTSTSSLIQNGITALNLPWSMSSIFGNGSKGDLVAREKKTMSVDSLETVQTESEDEESELEPEETEEEAREREEKAAAKKAKIEENENLREARWKAADEKATKRSSRVSMLSKASDMMSNMATSVLGKRPRSAIEKGKDKLEDFANKALQPRSMIEPLTAQTHAFEGPMTKKRRLYDGDVDKIDQTASIPTKKQILQRKHKRWLGSGLYAGQARAFNPCLTENKNKKKLSSKPEEPEKENSVIPLPMFAGERLIKQGRDFKLPFDIFSPLPAGQPKPDEWKKTNKNVFIGDAAEFWRVHKFQEYSTCLCRKDIGCDEDCINKMMYYECDDNNCLLTAEQCGNRAFAGLRERVKHGNKYDVGVEVLKTVDRGNGVRSNRCFAPNQIIVEYTGEILTQEECENRMHTRYKDNEASLAP